MALYQTDPASAVKYLNTYSNKQADQMLSRWKQLATYLIVKFNDMTVRPEENGRFKLTPEGIGARVSRPGYPEPFRRKLVKATGSKYEVPAE